MKGFQFVRTTVAMVPNGVVGSLRFVVSNDYEHGNEYYMGKHINKV